MPGRNKSVMTLRKIPSDVDAAITEQARLTGKSKNDLVLELLTATFGDLWEILCVPANWLP